jgi:hypothetical protein
LANATATRTSTSKVSLVETSKVRNWKCAGHFLIGRSTRYPAIHISKGAEKDCSFAYVQVANTAFSNCNRYAFASTAW